MVGECELDTSVVSPHRFSLAVASSDVEQHGGLLLHPVLTNCTDETLASQIHSVELDVLLEIVGDTWVC